MDVESSSAYLGMEEYPKIAAPPCRKLKIILKLKKKEDEVVPGPAVVPPTATSTSSSLENSMKLKSKKIEEIVVPGPAVVSSSLENNSMKLKLESTKRKLEQRYGEEAEKKAKKKIQRIDDFPNPKNHAGRSSKEVKAPALDQGEVRERVLANLKKLKKKNQNLTSKYTLH